MDVTVLADAAGYCRAEGPLESPLIWPGFTAAALVLPWVAVRWPRARRRAVIAAVCCALAAGLTGLNTYVGYTRTGHDLALLLGRGGAPGRAVGRLLDDGDDRAVPADAPSQDSFDHADPGDGIPSSRVYVPLPPGYANPDQTYPVVYLVHGYPFGSAQDWLTAGDAAGALDGLTGTTRSRPWSWSASTSPLGSRDATGRRWTCRRGSRLETFLSGPVVSAVDGRYRMIRDRAARALGSMAGGAFAALNIGLHHTDGFGVLLLTLPYDTPGDVRAEFHGDSAAIARNTPRDYLRGMVFHDPVAVLLAADGQQAVVHVEPGLTHTWRTARATLPYLLVFAGGHFPAA
ncbi:alpha/beta hydrolase [Amycolatopsis methanolica]|uniref:alpha/beta hydrolase n=1 Tax=Amycolatopsis methanolica TaxID=1814 RepID=UPI00342E5AE3